ncbi:MFS transporter [Propionicimonas sp.]|uniref:MFS transporter n=1 Tax=Propionicimonas sp. TaxID=1955623 RepID=UPI00183FDF26|nr:MFS transporter [Propionicimonas sp.]MBU3976278.1 MFS transporter [Actinomycetota bacterium]MBA3022128.1 MFS transporter [Propionicimonas sp.]MBU3987435.1 MFS transporter [Actinomycetota bacterium]MBU4006620.1 MFS transporter [Actinomycetota bacterium]MBU4065225.1 MFS transporter [Actinomycetota bacterium]
MSTSSQTKELLANSPYLVLLSARTLSMLGMAFAPVALAFGILALPGADAGTLSLVLAVHTLPMVVLMLVGGVVADRYPRQAVLVTGEWLAATGFAAIGVMLLTGYAPIWLLCVAAGVAGAAGAMIYPALSGIIPDLVPEHVRQKGNAWLAMGASAARLGGLVTGGAVVVWLGGGWAMVVAGALYLLAGALLLKLPRITGNIAGEAEHPIRQLIDGWGEFSSRQWLWVVVAQWSLMIMVLQAAQGVLGPVVAKTELGGAGAWTIILIGEALGAIVGVWVSMIWKPHRPILVATLMTVTAGVPPILLGLSAPLWTVVVSMFFLGVTFDLFGVLWMTTMQDEVPPESLARVASYDALGSLMLGPLGLILAGPAILAFGVHASLIGTGIISVVVTLLALLAPEVRQLRSKSSRHLELSEAIEDVDAASPMM